MSECTLVTTCYHNFTHSSHINKWWALFIVVTFTLFLNMAFNVIIKPI